MDEGAPRTVLPAESDPDASRALERVRAVSRILDSGIRVPGTSFTVGIDPILGVLPVAGDAVSAAVSLYIVAEAKRAGVPNGVLARMLGLVAVDFAVGSIPYAGVLFDAVLKANERNARMMAAHVESS